MLHLVLPILQFASHYLNMTSAQVSRKHPVDMNNFLYFVDVALDELQTHGLHQEKLDIVLIDLAVSGNAIKLQTAIVLINFEKKLEEGDDANFLLK